MVVAPVLLRVLAFLIDGAIVAVIDLGLTALIGDTGITNRETFALLIAVTATYHIGFLAVKSATPGKMAMNLYVGDRQGRAVRPDQAILRYMVLLVGNFVLVGTIASLVLILAEPQRRAVHDRVAGTLVLMGRPSQAASGEPWGRSDRFPRP